MGRPVPEDKARMDDMSAAHGHRKILLCLDLDVTKSWSSTHWLVSFAKVLSGTKSQVHVSIPSSLETEPIAKDLQRYNNIVVHPLWEPHHGARFDRLAGSSLEDLEKRVEPDFLIVDAHNAWGLARESSRLARRLWVYITDLPLLSGESSHDIIGDLQSVALNSHKVLVQSEEERSYLETAIPKVVGKTLIVGPLLPDDFFVELEKEPNSFRENQNVSLVSSWPIGLDAYTVVQIELEGLGTTAKQCISESEVQNVHQSLEGLQSGGRTSTRSGESDRYLELESLSMSDFLNVLTNARIGLAPKMLVQSAGPNVSTTALLYAAAGAPPILKRTVFYEAIFGEDYPLFLDTVRTSEQPIEDNIVSLSDFGQVRERTQAAVLKYRIPEVSKRFEHYLSRYEVISRGAETLPIFVVAGHDLKFTGDLVAALEDSSEYDLRFDHWDRLNRHDEDHSFEQLSQADVIFCEWAGLNAVWYSERVSEDQRLFIRLHGFEANAAWLPNIQIDNVTRIFVVSEHLKKHVLARTGWDDEKLVVVPNSLDVLDLDRPKLSNYQHRIGLVGMVPFLKRPDRAIDVLEQLLERDSRFTLHIRGRFPWEYPHIWRREREQEAYRDMFARIARSKELRNHVVFEPFGADMASWFRKIGWILSPSVRESFHLAPAEGMASGAIPMIWERDGAASIFTDSFIVEDSIEAANMILDVMQNPNFSETLRESAFNRALEFDKTTVYRKMFDVFRS